MNILKKLFSPKAAEKMILLAHEVLPSPIWLTTGDSLVVTYNETITETRMLGSQVLDSKVKPATVLAKHTVTAETAMTIVEVLLYSTQVDGRKVLGSLMLEAAK
jgi:predicted RNA-binding protein (virulence factor B family)